MDAFDKLLDNINKTIDKKTDDTKMNDKKQEDTNIEEYEHIEEETSKYVDCINICHIYFKNLFRKKNENIFTNIDDTDKYSTNREMEFVYETIYKYNINLANNSKLCDIYEPDKINNYLNKDDYTDLYGLSFNNEIIKICPSLFGIITYIAHEIDWKNKETIWAIMPLKSE